MIKKAMLICHGQITVGRAQIPKYQREADQPFRCAIIAAFSQCGGTRARYKPTWELLFALWHSGEWVLIAEASPVDKTDVIIHVQPSTREAFVSKFQGQKGQTKQYRPQSHLCTPVSLTAEKAAMRNTGNSRQLEPERATHGDSQCHPTDGEPGQRRWQGGRAAVGAGRPPPTLDTFATYTFNDHFY